MTLPQHALPEDRPPLEADAAPNVPASPTLGEGVDESVLARERSLVAWFRVHAPILIGYSGGVDSSYLAVVALEALGPSGVLAVIGRSASYPEAQWTTAREVADRFGVPVLEVNTDEIHDARYAANPTNRCYFCKSVLWDTLIPIAESRGFATIIDGTNADDLSGHRPGAAAARERRVASPLAELGFSKREIRSLSMARGLPTWSQPASPCLSSRLPYGTAVTPERLRAIERAEAALRALGVTGDLRVRYHGDLARVELCAEELPRWLDGERSARLAAAVRGTGFTRVAIDLRGFRSGSLNVLGGAAHG